MTEPRIWTQPKRDWGIGAQPSSFYSHRSQSYHGWKDDALDISNWDCSSSGNWWLYPHRALGQSPCCPAYSAWLLEWVHRPGQGKASQHCRTLWPRSPDTACSETLQSLQPSAWGPPSSLPDLFYFLKKHTNMWDACQRNTAQMIFLDNCCVFENCWRTAFISNLTADEQNGRAENTCGFGKADWNIRLWSEREWGVILNICWLLKSSKG